MAVWSCSSWWWPASCWSAAAVAHPANPEARGIADLAEEVKSQLLETRIYAKVREKFAKSRPVSQNELEKYFNEHKQI